LSRHTKLFRRILSGKEANIRFTALRAMLLYLGFEERTHGSHHVFIHRGVKDLINLQDVRGDAKPYQVRQVRRILLAYGFHLKLEG
jgi:hypothetical protein